MSSDGLTLYFSGVSKTEGLGQRDIYMTKFDAEDAKFLQAGNIGLPFNSAADDYAYIEADADKLAWFVSTRRQPAGKACVYTFIMPDARQNYDADEIEEKKLISYANITRIRDTWDSTQKRDKALSKLRLLKERANAASSYNDNMAFVVNDETTYTNVNQFKSEATRKAYYDIVRQQNDIKITKKKLEALRTQFHNTPENKRAAIGNQILQLEQKTDAARQSLKRSENELRMKESNLLNK